jgi:hypothetical protein
MTTSRSYALGALFAACVVCLGACSTNARSRTATSPSSTLSNVPVETKTSTTSELRLRNLSLPELRARFQQDVEFDPKDKYGWYNLGVVEGDLNKPASAVIDYTRAIALDPNFESALYNLGILRYQAHDYPAAVAFLSRAVAINPKDASARTNLNNARVALRAATPTGIPPCSRNEVQADAFVLFPSARQPITDVELRITNLSGAACFISSAPTLESTDNGGAVTPILYTDSTATALTIAPGAFASAQLDSRSHCFRVSHASQAVASVSISLSSGQTASPADPIQLVPCTTASIVSSGFSVHSGPTRAASLIIHSSGSEPRA